MTILYGSSYDVGAGAFRALSLTFLPVFLSAMFGNAVFSLNHEKKLFTYVILGVVGNFVFNLALIPWLGITGAALSTVINQSIITLYLMQILQKETRFTVLHQIEKITIATLIMGTIIVAAKIAGLNLYGIIVLGMIAYFLSLYLAKEEALTELWDMTKRQLFTRS
jgi:O-antigen/teichoic acid export membrane protein